MSAFVCLATHPLFTLVYKDRFTCTCIIKVYIFTFRLPFIKKKPWYVTLYDEFLKSMDVINVETVFF